ncbi:TIGR01777 family oxidoreductase [Nonomuraea sp. NBC_01738]|uniref:TIGR01777 family oxidoreductase n=1 Tax=Nonomuraea sp. NBC_01738 TaxID=2976003 RepID=UPI002E143F88|nr:TIGR01777 family oxidoreductase [Nonomuraea sp. NBC_01738]
MTIVVTGASGLLGPALVRELRAGGERVVTLVRHAPQGDDESFWDPAKGLIDPGALEGADGVVHLSGAPVAGRRWTEAYKRLLVSSRVDSTRTLVTALGGLSAPPGVLVSASGVDFYGDTGDRVVDEGDGQGRGFMAGLCRQWEDAARAAPAGVRTAQMRTGLVLTGEGGALGPMLPIFRMGLGAPLGSGRHWWSWIALADWVGAVRHILKNPDIEGPVNLTSPTPVTNAEFTRTLGKTLRRPTMPIGVPAFALGLGLGEFAREALLSSHRIMPKKLVDSGYGFAHTRLDQALAAVL